MRGADPLVADEGDVDNAVDRHVVTVRICCSGRRGQHCQRNNRFLHVDSPEFMDKFVVSETSGIFHSSKRKSAGASSPYLVYNKKREWLWKLRYPCPVLVTILDCSAGKQKRHPKVP